MVNEMLIPFGPIYENTATAAITDFALYIPAPPVNGSIKEIVAGINTAAGAGNSGSTTINFYRRSSGTAVASATTTGLIGSGGVSFNSGTTVGALTTVTLNTSIVTGKNAGMVVSGGTTLLIQVDYTATSTVNGIFGYMRWQEDMIR